MTELPLISPLEKVSALRQQMKANGVQAYIFPRADEFQGEFVAPYAERLAYITGFTGSAGAAIITEDKAAVLSDARYELQLKTQIDGDVFEAGDYIKTPFLDWLDEYTSSGDVIGYDPFLFTRGQIEKFSAGLEDKGVSLKAIEDNLVDVIWADQPPRPVGEIDIFPEQIAGASLSEKIDALCDGFNDGEDYCLIASPDSIAWLLNIRGRDIDYIPYVLSYAVLDIQKHKVIWFVDPDKKIPDSISQASDQIEVKDIKTITSYLNRFSNQKFIADLSRTPAVLLDGMNNVLDEKDPCILPRAQKTQSESAAIGRAHIEDAIALVKFMRWLEEEFTVDGSMNEYEVAQKLEGFRKESAAYKGASFPTICGFSENGAVIHYRATVDKNIPIDRDGLLLIDSGGQYLNSKTDDLWAGTTDITRTFAIGSPTEEMREMYTRVLKGHIALARAQFPRGTTGAQIDVYARTPLWDAGEDFQHGTGHGVGCYLAVHEEAASISSRGFDPLEPGMLISNEPGYYKEGEYGIRLENLVMVKELGVNGTTAQSMFGFKTFGFVPFDENLIAPELLSDQDRQWLNAYHEMVVSEVVSFLDAQDKEWLENKVKRLHV